jgi:hypothetical protein
MPTSKRSTTAQDAVSVYDGLKTNETCRFENHVFQEPVGTFIPPGPERCQSESRSGRLGVERSWHPFEEGRSAGAQSGRKRPPEHGKSVVFKPATFDGFRNDAEKRGAARYTKNVT